MIKKTANKVFSGVSKKNICIIGDLMLDIYFLGDVVRISPEAPVQIFEKTRSLYRLGGSANVGLNVNTLGANPFLIGVIGKDEEGKALKVEFRNQKISTDGLIISDERPTTSKTRVIASSHHLIRIDSESKNDIDKNTEKKIISIFKLNIKKFDAVILQDYNKGVLTKNVIEEIIRISNKNEIKVFVDPKFFNFYEYKNVFAFKPNRKELEEASGMKPRTDNELNDMCFELIEEINCDNLILTLGENGIKMFEKTKKGVRIESIQTRARKVSDVSGAGDTVISTMAVCVAGGASLKDSVFIANIAAGLVVEEVGIVPIEKNQLLEHINNHL
ncbi:MAG: D-glycero-beta-D-manno-heptose-7-phosphate kinase [Ignavibacteria bacterium]|nr:D-glycero-beta-D-manno-heptose-7-phosphate kinase [Ignavibacteria bacterium]